MKVMIALLLLVAVVSSAGCQQWKYTETPECELYGAPNPQQYLKGSTDERLVLMTMSYTGQVRKTAECNANIQKVNAKNKALFQK